MLQRFAITILVTVLMTACGTQPPAPEPGHTLTETQLLIEELASRFPPTPEEQGREVDVRQFIQPPIDNPLIRDAKRVQAVYQRLEKLGFAAFPDLVAASDDQRYSFTTGSWAERNVSVSEACFALIKSQVDVHSGYSAYRPTYMEHIQHTIGLKAWWKERKGWSLSAMQAESQRWYADWEIRNLR